jgi:hypothetical protein
MRSPRTLHEIDRHVSEVRMRDMLHLLFSVSAFLLRGGGEIDLEAARFRAPSPAIWQDEYSNLATTN